MLPNYLPIDSITEEGTLDVTLLSVQAAIINQIVQVTRGTLVLDEALNAIANQMQGILHASGCLIFQSNGCQPKAASQISGMITQHDSSGVAIPNSYSLSFPCEHPEIAERLYKIGSDVYQYFHSWLAQGKSVILPRIEPRLLPALDCGGESGFCAVLIVPMLYRQSYLGTLMLYQCQQQREWMPQEIAFVKAIADQCAIALTLAELEEYHQTTAKNCILLEAIPDSIFRVTRAGICLDWKPGKEGILAVSASEIIGKHLHQVLPSDVAGLIWEHIELAFETEDTQIVEYQLSLNGQSRNFEARLVPSGLDEAIAASAFPMKTNPVCLKPSTEPVMSVQFPERV